MARKATRSKARRPASRARFAANRPAPTGSPRERIIEAFMLLLAEQPIGRIGLAEIAERAGVTLADLRGEFGNPLAILGAQVKELDRKVLRTWVDDEDDNTQTLAALDRELARGQRFAGLLDDLCRIPEAACNFRQQMRGSRRGRRDRDDRVHA